MKIQTYWDLKGKITGEMVGFSENLCKPLVPKFAKKYCGGNEYGAREGAMAASMHLTRLLYVASRNLTDKVILDLGCGSVLPELDNFLFEPWLCRALNEMGVRVIGIDIGNLDGEEFEHHSLDLRKKDSLGFLPDNSVDLAHSYQLFTSPRLREYSAGKELKDNLMPQLERILKPEGVFIYEI